MFQKIQGRPRASFFLGSSNGQPAYNERADMDRDGDVDEDDFDEWNCCHLCWQEGQVVGPAAPATSAHGITLLALLLLAMPSHP
jgi:hypothetical protein